MTCLELEAAGFTLDALAIFVHIDEGLGVARLFGCEGQQVAFERFAGSGHAVIRRAVDRIHKTTDDPKVTAAVSAVIAVNYGNIFNFSGQVMMNLHDITRTRELAVQGGLGSVVTH